MPERWRRPAEVLDVREVHQGILLPDGRVQGAVELVMSEDTIERMRLGYMCAKCLEPFEQAWPERCPVCGAPIRDKQSEYFENEFAGEAELGSKARLVDEDIWDEIERRRTR